MTVVSRTQYFDAAMDLLAVEGFGAVKVSALCTRFGVTVGSFYHHFANVEAFVDALLDHWEQEQTQRIEDLAAVPVDPEARVERMKQLTVGIPHAAEAAIRAWGAANPQVAVALKRIDEHRRRALQDVIEGVVPDRRAARHLSVVGLTLLIGLQQWRAPVRAAELRRMLDEFDAMIRRYAEPHDRARPSRPAALSAGSAG